MPPQTNKNSTVQDKYGRTAWHGTHSRYILPRKTSVAARRGDSRLGSSYRIVIFSAALSSGCIKILGLNLQPLLSRSPPTTTTTHRRRRRCIWLLRSTESSRVDGREGKFASIFLFNFSSGTTDFLPGSGVLIFIDYYWIPIHSSRGTRAFYLLWLSAGGKWKAWAVYFRVYIGDKKFVWREQRSGAKRISSLQD